MPPKPTLYVMGRQQETVRFLKAVQLLEVRLYHSRLDQLEIYSELNDERSLLDALKAGWVEGEEREEMRERSE